MNDISDETAVVIKRFEFWVSRLVQIKQKTLNACCELADLGVVTSEPVHKVGPKDPPRVVRLKEVILAAQREREDVAREMERREAVLIDPRNYEIGLFQGPKPGRWLSWMPGEDDLGHYREEPTTSSARCTLDPHTTLRGSRSLH